MNEAPPRPVDWKKVKKSFGWSLVATAVVGGLLSLGLWGTAALVADEGVILCLALGFWLTERLIAVFTQTRKANGTAIVLLLFGKVAWWGALFAVARHMPPGLDRPVATGIGSFLLALLVAMLRHYGMPRISDGNPPVAP